MDSSRDPSQLDLSLSDPSERGLWVRVFAQVTQLLTEEITVCRKLLRKHPSAAALLLTINLMAGTRSKPPVVEAICPDCGAALRIDTQTGAIVSHTPAPRKRTFENLETAAKAMREQDDRKESIFRQSLEAEKNKEDLLEKRFAEALRKAKDAPAGKPLREFDLD